MDSGTIKRSYSNPNARPINPQLRSPELEDFKPPEKESSSKLKSKELPPPVIDKTESIEISIDDLKIPSLLEPPEEIGCKNSKKGDVQPKSIIEAHPETMATIKQAVTDIACIMYGKTSEAAAAAATMIQDQGKKAGLPTFLSDSEGPKKIYETIETAVTIISNSAQTSYESYKNKTINNDSSKYDVPDPDLRKHCKNQPAKPPVKCVSDESEELESIGLFESLVDTNINEEVSEEQEKPVSPETFDTETNIPMDDTLFPPSEESAYTPPCDEEENVEEFSGQKLTIINNSNIETKPTE